MVKQTQAKTKAKSTQTLGEVNKKMVLLQIKKKTPAGKQELRALKKERAEQVRSKNNGK